MSLIVWKIHSTCKPIPPFYSRIHNRCKAIPPFYSRWIKVRFYSTVCAPSPSFSVNHHRELYAFVHSIITTVRSRGADRKQAVPIQCPVPQIPTLLPREKVVDEVERWVVRRNPSLHRRALAKSSWNHNALKTVEHEGRRDVVSDGG